ncbi:MAG: toll/interleukin-1 receptor domain-containing protein [Verrucomicrobiota bacterium]
MNDAIDWNRGFVSYSHTSVRGGSGLFRKLISRLEKSIREEEGSKRFSLVIDRGALLDGDDWETKLRREVTRSGLLIPLITPQYFESKYCKLEYETFRERNIRMNCEDCVFPIYFRTCDQMTSPEEFVGSEWVQFMAQYQFSDWRKSKENFELQDLLQPISKLASRIVQESERMSLSGGSKRWKPKLGVSGNPEPEAKEYADYIDATFLSLTGTQKHIVRRVCKLTEPEISIDELYQSMTLQKAEFFSSEKELLYRTKELAHQGLLLLEPFSNKKSFVKPITSVCRVLTDRNRLTT